MKDHSFIQYALNHVFTCLLTFHKGLSCSLPAASKARVWYTEKSVRDILGLTGHTSSLSCTPSPSKSSKQASPYESPDEKHSGNYYSTNVHGRSRRKTLELITLLTLINFLKICNSHERRITGKSRRHLILTT